jgi:hypothetical protein
MDCVLLVWTWNKTNSLQPSYTYIVIGKHASSNSSGEEAYPVIL